MLTQPHAAPAASTTAPCRTTTIRELVCSTQERSTKTAADNGGFNWQQRLAMRLLPTHFPTKSGLCLGTARSIYVALTEIAADQFTPSRVKASNAHIGKVAGYSADTIHRYVREFAHVGLLKIEEGHGQYEPNTYILLIVVDANRHARLSADTMPLADGAGQSRGGVGATPEAIPTKRRGGVGATPQPANVGANPSGRGGTHATQIQRDDSRIKESNKQAVGVGPVGSDSADVTNEQSRLGPVPSTQIPQPTTTLSNEQQATAHQLIGLGVQRRVAEELALKCSPAAVTGWITYTHTAKGITSPAGFVLAKLRAGDEPPLSSQPVAQGWLAEYAAVERKRQEEEAMRLLARYGVDQPTLELWLAVCDRLETDHDEAYYLCFKDAFLACPDAHTALLVIPSRVALEQAACYESLLRELLLIHTGADLSLHFEHPRPGDEPINFADAANAPADEQPAMLKSVSEPPAHEPVTPWMQSVWLAAADDLRKLVGDHLWHSWLAQVRLIGRDDNTWLLRQPCGSVPLVLAERWGGRIAAVLAGIYGQVVRLGFTV